MAALSGRAKRMMEHQARRKKTLALNLVSLMDIFTILVFFLLVNSSDVQTLPNSKGLEMPDSIAEVPARETIVVKVTPEQIAVDGVAVIGVPEASRSASNVLAPLGDALRAQNRAHQTEITVMADKSLPYSLLKKIMTTCADAQFERVSLAVIQRAPGTEPG